MLDPVEGDKADAADVPAHQLPEFINDLLLRATPWEQSTAPDAGGESFRLKWRDMADVVDLPPVDWILPGVIAASSLTLLTGATKAGKTLFTLALLKAATTGQPFLGYTVRPMRGWYLTETSDYALKGQLGVLDWIPPRGMFPVAYKSEQDFHLMTPQAFADGLLWDYEAALSAGRAPNLICIDTLGRWLRGFDFNDYSAVNAATEPLLRAADSMMADGCVVLLLHHQRKSGGRGTDGSLGSQALTGAVDTHCGLTVKPNKSEIRELSIQSRYGIGALGTTVDIELSLPSGEYRLVSGDAEDFEDSVLEYLTDRPDGATPKAIRDALEIEDANQLTRLCKMLFDRGAITRTGKARTTRYFLSGEEPGNQSLPIGN